jgi:hypothetical protein
MVKDYQSLKGNDYEDWTMSRNPFSDDLREQQVVSVESEHHLEHTLQLNGGRATIYMQGATPKIHYLGDNGLLITAHDCTISASKPNGSFLKFSNGGLRVKSTNEYDLSEVQNSCSDFSKFAETFLGFYKKAVDGDVEHIASVKCNTMTELLHNVPNLLILPAEEMLEEIFTAGQSCVSPKIEKFAETISYCLNNN